MTVGLGGGSGSMKSLRVEITESIRTDKNNQCCGYKQYNENYDSLHSITPSDQSTFSSPCLP